MIPPETISITEWVHIGIWLIRRDSLPTSHPESTYQQIKKMGLVPEEYGIKKIELEDLE